MKEECKECRKVGMREERLRDEMRDRRKKGIRERKEMKYISTPLS